MTLLIQTLGKDATKELLTIVEGSGYRFPTAANVTQTINRSDSVNSLGPVIIKQLDGDGVIIEQWKLHNPFIKEVSFDGLDYESDDLSEITLGIVYDWAELEKAVMEAILRCLKPRDIRCHGGAARVRNQSKKIVS